jgi:hypothetical protein
MSLTSFLQRNDVRDKFKQEFPKPKLVPSQEILAPLVSKNPRLIGTAFDYLMRFYAKYVNPQAIEQEWIAEKSLRLLRQPGFKHLYEQGYLIITQAKENYLEFLKTGQATEALIQSALGLAKLDSMYRSGKVKENLQQQTDFSINIHLFRSTNKVLVTNLSLDKEKLDKDCVKVNKDSVITCSCLIVAMVLG